MITQVCGMLKPGLYPEIGRKILNYCEPQSHTDPVATTTTTSITSSSGCITTNINMTDTTLISMTETDLETDGMESIQLISTIICVNVTLLIRNRL